MARRVPNGIERDRARASVRRTGWIVAGIAIAMAIATVSLILGPWSPDRAELERALAEDSSVSVPASGREPDPSP